MLSSNIASIASTEPLSLAWVKQKDVARNKIESEFKVNKERPKNLSYGLLPLAMEVEALFFCALKGIASLVESLVHFNISKLLIITKGKDLKTRFYAK